jgi:tRNA-intron endonuclease, archaea type
MAKAKAFANGTLDGDGVLVADVSEANRLHNKAVAGTPTKSNGLRLTLVEAAHCVASGWLVVAHDGKTLGAADLVARSKAGSRALTDYLVYRDLRERGFVARHAPGTSHFDVWPRGTAQGKPQFQNVCCSTADPAGTDDLLQGAEGGIVCSVVDEDSTVTHYQVAHGTPAGGVPLGSLPKVAGKLLADRVLVTDPAAAAAYAKEWIGTPQGDGVFLSALEAAALQARGALRLDGALPTPPAAEVLRTYTALREAGVVVKSGFRFGAHLRGYVGAPDDTHAQWLLHCAKPGEALPWSALSRGVRLAHGVRKQFLVAVLGRTGVRFVHIAWLRL